MSFRFPAMSFRFPLLGARARTAAASSSGAWILSRSGETDIVPGGSGRNSVCGALAISQLAIPCSDSSKAYAGGGSLNSSASFISLDKRDLVDLLQGRNPLPYLFDG